MLNARGRDPCLRRLKADLVKPSREQQATLVTAARAQLEQAEALVAAGADATGELKRLKTELARFRRV